MAEKREAAFPRPILNIFGQESGFLLTFNWSREYL
jgi:hypothetical protein